MNLTALALLASMTLFAGACDSSSTAAPDDAAAPDLTPTVPIGTDTSVTILDKATHKSGEVVKGPFTVVLPDKALFSKINLHIDLTCPGACDPYDRIASIRMLLGDKKLEVGRFITPFGVKGSWDLDVTELMPVLFGEQKFESYLETYSNGWVVTARLEYVGGMPSPEPVSVTPLAWERLPVGDPAKKVDDSLPPFTAMPGQNGATSARLRVIVTGHGQGNSQNCAEFCDLSHTVLVDGKEAETRSIWRDDCAQNPISNQKGSWPYPREGWCPGDIVTPWLVDLGARSAPFKISYASPGNDDGGGMVTPYENTCSPMKCQTNTCALRTGCDYDGGAHTDPNFFISAAVIGYR